MTILEICDKRTAVTVPMTMHTKQGHLRKLIHSYKVDFIERFSKVYETGKDVAACDT